MPATDPISVVEACYRLEQPESEWLDGLLEAAHPLFDRGLGTGVHTFETSSEGVVTIRDMRVLGMDESIGQLARLFLSEQPEAELRRTHIEFGAVGSLSEVIGVRNVAGSGSAFASLFSSHGIGDVMGARALDPLMRGVVFNAPMKRPRSAESSFRRRWTRIMAHVGVAQRLRSRLAASPGERAGEAVLEPGGTVLHAEGEAKPLSARDKLRRAALDIDRARARSVDEDAALELWRGLVDGRWSLVDAFEADGRRVLIAHRNEPGVRDPRGLSDREARVAAYAALGHDPSEIAYLMGISPATVATHLRSVQRKLGLASRSDLPECFEASA